jgi:hypothetical protein
MGHQPHQLKNLKSNLTPEMDKEGKHKVKMHQVVAEAGRETPTLLAQLNHPKLEDSQILNKFNNKDNKWPTFTTKEDQACSTFVTIQMSVEFNLIKTNKTMFQIKTW